MSEVVAKEFDLAWARYWLKKYQKEHKMKEASLVAQLIGHQETLRSESILGRSLLVDGFFSFALLKEVLEEDLDYNLNSPKNLIEYRSNRNKSVFGQKPLIIIS